MAMSAFDLERALGLVLLLVIVLALIRRRSLVDLGFDEEE